MEIGFATLLAVLGVVVLKTVFVLVPIGTIVWFATRTPTGRRFFGLSKARRDESLSLEVADQLRALQGQLDDVHARLDFAERVMLEQRDQLRVLGAPEPSAGLREPTPV